MATKKQIVRAVDTHFAAAIAARKERRRRGDLAVAAGYDPRSKRLRIELASGVSVSLPVSMVQGLADVAPSKIKSVQIDGNGYGLHRPEPDIDVSVPGLIAGCFGTRVWMTALARHGGKSTSAAKKRGREKTGRRVAVRGDRPRPHIARAGGTLRLGTDHSSVVAETPGTLTANVVCPRIPNGNT